MNVTITRVHEKASAIGRLSGILHDANVLSATELAENHEFRLELRRIAYESPGAENRLWGLFRNRTYPWLPVTFVVSPIVSVRVDRDVADEKVLRNEFHAMNIQGMELYIGTMFTDYWIQVTEETSILSFDSGELIGPGIRQFGPPFDVAGVTELLGKVEF